MVDIHLDVCQTPVPRTRGGEGHKIQIQKTTLKKGWLQQLRTSHYNHFLNCIAKINNSWWVFLVRQIMSIYCILFILQGKYSRTCQHNSRTTGKFCLKKKPQIKYSTCPRTKHDDSDQASTFSLKQLFVYYNVRVRTASLTLVSVKWVTNLLFQILLNNSRDSFNRFWNKVSCYCINNTIVL